jgi:hypothetical protein
VDSGLLRVSPKFFELLPNVLGDSAKPLGCLAIYLACNTLQLVHYPLLLSGLSLVVRYNPRGFRRPALALGP